MCRERMCPNCKANDWMLVEMPQWESNALKQRKVHFLLQCRKCAKVYFTGEYWVGKAYQPFSEEFNPTKRKQEKRIVVRKES